MKCLTQSSTLRKLALIVLLFSLPAISYGQCAITSFSVIVGGCDTSNTFEVSGNFVYDNNPGTGTVVVEATNSSGTYSETFIPPFINLIANNFSITGIPSDGSPLTITVYFSDMTTCSAVVNSISAMPCECVADIGTFSIATSGMMVGDTVVLCLGDTVAITPNGDYTPPNEAFSPPGPVYSPGIAWLVYTCPPTVGLVPDPLNPIPNDPCFLGLVNNMNELNDLSWITGYPGAFNDNVVYFVPLTMYSMTSTVYSYVNTSMPCYAMGTVYPVQFLETVSQTVEEDCTAGTVTVHLSGGYPALSGTTFDGTNLLPATASFTIASAANGDSIVVSGLTIGDSYSFDIGGCATSIGGTFGTATSPTFGYSQADYCDSDPVQLPTMYAPTGGLFSASSGLSLDPVSGFIVPSTSTPGTYGVTYTGPGACGNPWTETVTIHATTSSSITEITCGSYYSPAGNTYSTTGIYIDTVANVAGCDSIITIDLTVNAVTYSFLSESACDSYLSVSGNMYTTSGIYIDTILNAAGCDSITTVDLTINYSLQSTQLIQSCGPYTSPAGNTYSTTGIYMDTITLVTGCDSIITIDLTVGTASTSSISEVVCDSYTSVSGNVYTTSGIYTDTTLNAAGCDSIITLDLTVNYSSQSTQLIQSCGPYTSSTGVVYDTTGIYIEIIPNAAGCDSTITLDLTVTTIYSIVTSTGATLFAWIGADTYQWINCSSNQPISGATSSSYLPPVNGTYKVALTVGTCSDTSSCTTISNVSLVQLSIDQIIVFPNPSSNGWFSIEAESLEISALRMVDVLGRDQQVSVDTELGIINASTLASGEYFIEIVSVEGEVYRHSVIIK